MLITDWKEDTGDRVGDNGRKLQDFFNGTRESTFSSPSGIHYGHYFAACESKILKEVNLLFMPTPFKFGMPLTRRTSSLHCMIQKMSVLYVNKLRIAQLYEVDFNSILKLLLGKWLM